MFLKIRNWMTLKESGQENSLGYCCRFNMEELLVIITPEDVIEEIVGDISDEFDDEELIYSKLDNSTYVFDAKINLKDFYKVIENDEDESLKS